MTLSENIYEENLLATSTGIKEYAAVIGSWMSKKFFGWGTNKIKFDLKNHCDDNIDQKVEVCRDENWLGHKVGQTFYKRPSGKSLLK